MKFQMKKKGVILLEAMFAILLLGMASYGFAETSTVQFQQMSAAKVASQAQDYAEIEAKYLLELGYEDVDSLGIHDRTSMESLIGVEGWESETKIVSTKSLSGGNNNEVKVVGIDVYKEGDSTPRYSVSVPLVKGLAVYTKDEIDAMVDKINTDITSVNTDLQTYKSSTNETLGDLQNQITTNLNQVNADLDALEKKIEANSAAIAAANINISKNAANIETINTQISSIKDTISSLQGTVNALQNALAAETVARQSADSTLQNNINSEITARKAAVDALTVTMNSRFTTLQNQINAITDRLNTTKEFVRSKDSANDIQLKYEADASGNKAINAYVDGTKVPLSSQGGSKIPIIDYDSPLFLIGDNSISYHPSGTPYKNVVITTDGYALVEVVDYSGRSGGLQCNGNMVYENDFGSDQAWTSLFIPVKKGDTLTTFGSSSLRRVIIYPCK